MIDILIKLLTLLGILTVGTLAVVVGIFLVSLITILIKNGINKK